jgi:hypothetical protein
LEKELDVDGRGNRLGIDEDTFENRVGDEDIDDSLFKNCPALSEIKSLGILILGMQSSSLEVSTIK